MRVLHFYKTYWPDSFGGVERTIHAIAKGTESYGIQSDVLSLSKSPEERTLPFDGHMAYKARLDVEIASTGLSRSVFSRFGELAKAADVIHYHFPWPLMDVVDLVTGHGKPSLVTYHSDIVKQQKLLLAYRPLMHHFLRGVDHIVATSPNYLDTSDVLRRFRSKTSVIPIGLDPADYPEPDAQTRAKWRRILPERFFVFVGVLRYYKGLHVLLDAAHQTGLPVVIIGDGPLREAVSMQRAARNLGNIHFFGALPDKDKIAILDLSRALLFPSHLRSEAFGLSLVEASMRGKPMISCENGTGASYVNQHGTTGLVVPPNDAAAFASGMTTLAGDDDLVTTLGANARQRYLDNFTAEPMCAAYARLYQQLARA